MVISQSFILSLPWSISFSITGIRQETKTSWATSCCKRGHLDRQVPFGATFSISYNVLFWSQFIAEYDLQVDSLNPNPLYNKLIKRTNECTWEMLSIDTVKRKPHHKSVIMLLSERDRTWHHLSLNAQTKKKKKLFLKAKAISLSKTHLNPFF